MCKLCNLEVTNALSPAFEQSISKHNSRIVKAVFGGSFNGIIDEQLTTIVAENFKHVVTESIETASENALIDFEALQTKLSNNVSQFAVYKNAKFIVELKQAASLIADLKEYQATAKAIAKNYNENYLRTETNWAQRTAAQATRWQDIQLYKDKFGWLEFNTRGDERVRFKHSLFHGKRFPVDHPFWKTYYPPISGDWGCRCFVTQEFEPGDDTLNEKYFKVDDNNISPAISGIIFNPKKHPYFKGFSKKEKEELNSFATSFK